MIGIEKIACYIPTGRRSNFENMERFEIDEHFIVEKIGVKQVAIKQPDEEASSMCEMAWLRLEESLRKDLQESVDCLVVITQNPDSNIPHVSAKLQGSFGLKETCACFDVSLGCSGYVYGLSIIEAFMKNNGFNRGLLFTADPYSKIVNPDDKNTALLFGDAATVTVIGPAPIYTSGKYQYSNFGNLHHELVCEKGELHMNGRAIFDFAAKHGPTNLSAMLDKNSVNVENVDLFLFHQGSKYIVDTLAKRGRLDKSKVPFLAAEYGNTVSSTIPIMLEAYLTNTDVKTIAVSGFGVGLSIASTILFRN